MNANNMHCIGTRMWVCTAVSPLLNSPGQNRGPFVHIWASLLEVAALREVVIAPSLYRTRRKPSYTLRYTLPLLHVIFHDAWRNVHAHRNSMAGEGCRVDHHTTNKKDSGVNLRDQPMTPVAQVGTGYCAVWNLRVRMWDGPGVHVNSTRTTNQWRRWRRRGRVLRLLWWQEVDFRTQRRVVWPHPHTQHTHATYREKKQ